METATIILKIDSLTPIIMGGVIGILAGILTAKRKNKKKQTKDEEK